METTIAQSASINTGTNTQVSTQTQGSTAHHGSVVNTIEAPVEANHAAKAQKGVDQNEIKQDSSGVGGHAKPLFHDAETAAQSEVASRAEDLQEQLEKVRDHFSAVGRNLEFSVDKDSEKLVVKVVDPVTKETIRQIPSEKFLKMSETLQQARGNLVDYKV